MKIFLDIETIPLGDEPVYKSAPEFGGCKVPANYKDPAKIAKYKEENEPLQLIAHLNEHAAKHLQAVEEFKKGALKATRSQIVCICAVGDSKEIDPFKLSTTDEHCLLIEFGYWCSKFDSTHYVGHNIENFDIPMIRTHAIKHELIKLKERFTFKKFSENILDTMTIWDKKNWTKLNEIAEFLGIKNLNGDTDGSDIYDLYKAGKFEEIETKCMNDVIMCKEVYERIC